MRPGQAGQCQAVGVKLQWRRGRKRWIPAVPVKGRLWLDAGARRAVLDRKQVGRPLASLFEHGGGSPGLCLQPACWACAGATAQLLCQSGALHAGRQLRQPLLLQSLFAAGILQTTGDFSAQDAVILCAEDGTELGRGLVNYSCSEVNQVKVLLALELHMHAALPAKLAL